MITMNYIVSLRKILSIYDGIVHVVDKVPTIEMSQGGVYVKYTCPQTFKILRSDNTYANVADWQEYVKIADCYDLNQVKNLGDCANNISNLFLQIADMRDAWAIDYLKENQVTINPWS